MADLTTGAAATDGRGTLTVRLFAGARAAAGTAQTRLSPADGDRLADVVTTLAAGSPALATVLPACSFLLDGVASRPEQPVAGARTLDVLPPFSGG